jgi:hypothetical protein
MQEPVAPRPPGGPSEEVEELREQLRRLEARHAEAQQKLFDHYEWTRQKTKEFAKELRSLKNISLEYKVLHFLHGIHQRTTGLPAKTLEEEVELIEVSLVALPARKDNNVDEWYRSLLRQTHAKLALIIVMGESAPPVPQDVKDSAQVREVRVDDSYSDAIRADIGLLYASGEVRGFVVSGYWPYERTVENIARFFCQYPDCHLMAPMDMSIVDGLIAPTESPGERDFTELWKGNFARLGSLFFRPEVYQKLGRFVSDTGEAWIYATMLYLGTYFRVGTPSSLIFVNASAKNSEPEMQVGKESAYREVRKRFYLRSPFRDFDKAVWYFPVTPANAKVQSLRKLVEQTLLCIRCFVLWPSVSWFWRLQRKFFSPVVPLSFPVRPADHFSQSDEVELYPVEPCPLTEKCPDRLLFSLLPEGAERIADVFYDTASSIAIVNRSRMYNEASAKGFSTGGTRSVRGVRFIQPIALESVAPIATGTVERCLAGEADSGRDCAPLEKDSGEPSDKSPENGLAIAYEAVVTALAKGMVGAGAVWIGDRRFGPNTPSGLRHGSNRIGLASEAALHGSGYEQIRDWDEVPALVTADLLALRELDLLSGRNPEMGTGLDLIHLAGVLQFCRRPRHLLRFLAMNLKYDRHILVSTPNLDSVSLKRFGPAWHYWQPGRSCFIYGVNALRSLMKHCGFEEEKLTSFSQSRSEPAESRLDGDFLIGLYARKL